MYRPPANTLTARQLGVMAQTQLRQLELPWLEQMFRE
jgi:hypothetical protein